MKFVSVRLSLREGYETTRASPNWKLIALFGGYISPFVVSAGSRPAVRRHQEGG